VEEENPKAEKKNAVPTDVSGTALIAKSCALLAFGCAFRCMNSLAIPHGMRFGECRFDNVDAVLHD
jgi:hypothetical protein